MQTLSRLNHFLHPLLFFLVEAQVLSYTYPVVVERSSPTPLGLNRILKSVCATSSRTTRGEAEGPPLLSTEFFTIPSSPSHKYLPLGGCPIIAR